MLWRVGIGGKEGREWTTGVIRKLGKRRDTSGTYYVRVSEIRTRSGRGCGCDLDEGHGVFCCLFVVVGWNGEPVPETRVLNGHVVTRVGVNSLYVCCGQFESRI